MSKYVVPLLRLLTTPPSAIHIHNSTHTPAAVGDAHRRFHAVVASEVIEHVESPPDFMRALAGAVSLLPPSSVRLVGPGDGACMVVR